MDIANELMGWILQLNQECVERYVKIIQLRSVLLRIASYERGSCTAREADEMIDLASETLKNIRLDSAITF